MRGANRSGHVAEDVLAEVMRGVGLRFERQVVMGKNIYRENLRVDFVITNLAAFPSGLIVESKWQDRDGSVDEKFPYLVENIQRCYPLPAVVVAHGGGHRPGALAYLEERVDGQRFVALYSLEGFMSWALRAQKLTPRTLFSTLDQ